MRLGSDRAAWAYRARSLDGACPLLLGSDYPIGQPKPSLMVKELVGDQHTDRTPQERLTRRSALDALTRDPLSMRPRQVAVGAQADFVVFAGQSLQPEALLWLIVDGRLTRTTDRASPRP